MPYFQSIICYWEIHPSHTTHILTMSTFLNVPVMNFAKFSNCRVSCKYAASPRNNVQTFCTDGQTLSWSCS